MNEHVEHRPLDRVGVQALAHRQVALRVEVDEQHPDPISPNATPRLSVVVVFATPPFWFANAITRVATRSEGAAAGVGSVAGAPNVGVTIGRARGRARSRRRARRRGRAPRRPVRVRERPRPAVVAGGGWVPMTSPRSPRSRRLLHVSSRNSNRRRRLVRPGRAGPTKRHPDLRSILTVPVVQHVEPADEADAAEAHLP